MGGLMWVSGCGRAIPSMRTLGERRNRRQGEMQIANPSIGFTKRQALTSECHICNFHSSHMS